MTYTIDRLYEKLLEDVHQVYDVFINYFGEDKVDLVNTTSLIEVGALLTNRRIHINDGTCNVTANEIDSLKQSMGNSYIYVWWPMVTVANENDYSTTIQNLYAKIKIDNYGKIPYELKGFQLIRSTFPKNQYISGYMHSHVTRFHGIPEWKNPCLGRGPINDTILELKRESNEITWMLFCEELNRYVRVESLSGGPYIRLESIGTSELHYYYQDYDPDITYKSMYLTNTETSIQKKRILNDFLQWYLNNNHLTFSFDGQSFICGMPFYDYIIDVSNAFIQWFNDNLHSIIVTNDLLDFLFVRVVVSNRKFYKANIPNRTDASTIEGQYLFDFKGREVNLHIIDTPIETAHNEVTLLEQKKANWIINTILATINYRYNNEHRTNNRQEGENTAPHFQTVHYL